MDRRARLGWHWILIAGIAIAVVVAGVRIAIGDRPIAQGSPSRAPVGEATTAQPDDRRLPTFAGGGVTFSYPPGWRIWRTSSISTMGSTIAIVGTVDLSPCGADEIDINCAYATPLQPGQVLVVVGTGAAPGGSIQEPPGGFTQFVDGMPAVVTSQGPIAQTRQDEGRGWQIGMPGVVDNWYIVGASMRGPGLDVLRAQVDLVAESIRFDRKAPALPADAAGIDALVAKAVDALDRGARDSSHSRYYACFPRRVGSSEPMVIEDGPGGPLSGPIRVTCSIEARPSPVGLLAVTLSAHWSDGPGYAAGTYRELLYVDGGGDLGSMQSFNDTFFPSARPQETPGPATTPIALSPGSLVEVLYPGVTFYRDTDRGDALSDLPFGQRIWIVDGPRNVGGDSWYRVQWQPTPTYDGIPGWMADTLDRHPVVEPAQPRCPERIGDVVDIVNLIPAERLACFASRDLTLGPVFIASEPNRTAQATGEPTWLASSATLAMYGSEGADGVDAPLMVRLDPALADLPTRTWLEIVGHFDDARAAHCTRQWTPDQAQSTSPETPSEQELACREQFVITAARRTAAPPSAS